MDRKRCVHSPGERTLRYIITRAALVAIAASAFADVASSTGSASQESFLTRTVEPNGPRQHGGALNPEFFNVEGALNGSFPSSGVPRFDGASIVNDLNASLGVNNWEVESVPMSLFQPNAEAGLSTARRVAADHPRLTARCSWARRA